MIHFPFLKPISHWMYSACGAMFAPIGVCYSNTLPRGLDGILLQKERRGCLPTGPISLVMIWRTKLGLIMIGMPGTIGKQCRPSYGSFVYQVLRWSSLVRMESWRTSMPRFEKKRDLSRCRRCNFFVVSKIFQHVGWRRESKSMTLLVSHSRQLCFGPGIFCWRRSESRGCVDNRESLSLFHLFTLFGQGILFVVCLGVFVGCGCCFCFVFPDRVLATVV